MSIAGFRIIFFVHALLYPGKVLNNIDFVT